MEVSTARVSGWDHLTPSAHADGTDSIAHAEFSTVKDS